jgi:hypothetical protein
MKNVLNTLDRSVRRRVQVATSMVLVLVLAVGAFVLQPEYSRASEALDEVGRLGRESTSIVATESMLRSLEMERERRYGIERSQLREIPLGAGHAGLSDALALNVDDGGATSWSVRLLEPEEIETESETIDWMCLPAVVEMKGRFGTVIAALNRVESSDRLVRVRSIRVARVRNAPSDSDQIEATVDLDTVFAAEKPR